MFGLTVLLAVAVAALPPSIQEPERGSVLLPDRGQDLPDWALDEVKRRDPGYDQWRTEVLHDKAKPVLAGLLDAMLGDDPPAVPVTGIPGPAKTVTDRGWVVIRRAEGGKEGPLGAAQGTLADLGARILDVVPEDSEVHPHAKTIRVVLGEGGSFASSALVRVDAEAGEARAQLNLTLELQWTDPGEDLAPVLESVKVISWEEVSVPRPLFADFTKRVFGNNKNWRGETLHGVGDWRDHTDRLMGRSFIGAQGVAVGDVNGDGREEIYICQQGGLPNRLYMHTPSGDAADVTAQAQLGFLENTRAALFLDIDQDGHQDLVMAMGPNLLLAFNDGKGVFRELLPIEGEGVEDIYSLAAADPDGDGDLDIYACRYVLNGLLGGVPTPYHDADNGAPNLFFRQETPHKWTLAAAEVGLDHNNSKFSLAALWEDFDQDGDPDLYVANDFGRNNFYRNDDGIFTDVAAEIGADDLAAGMGVSAADYDLDGDWDLYISNMFSSAGQRIAPQSDRFMDGENQEVHGHYMRHARGNTLLENLGDGTFRDVTDLAGVAVGGWAWGGTFVDIDNDGLPDIHSPDGFVTNRDLDDL